MVRKGGFIIGVTLVSYQANFEIPFSSRTETISLWIIIVLPYLKLREKDSKSRDRFWRL